MDKGGGVPGVALEARLPAACMLLLLLLPLPPLLLLLIVCAAKAWRLVVCTAVQQCCHQERAVCQPTPHFLLAQDWLESQGLDMASAPRPRPSTQATIHRRQMAAGGRAGSSTAGAAAAARQQQQAQEGGQAEGGAPRNRDGKRAYLRALPQLPTAGPTPHQVGKGV